MNGSVAEGRVIFVPVDVRIAKLTPLFTLMHNEIPHIPYFHSVSDVSDRYESLVPKLELDVTSRQQVYGTRYSNVYRLWLQGGGDVCVKALRIVGDLSEEAIQSDHKKRVNARTSRVGQIRPQEHIARSWSSVMALTAHTLG